MPQKGGGLLAKYGLSRNPFTDRTAEKTDLDDTSLYLHADLQNFRPSEETYLFFGKRGSGKTTVRLSMMRTYEATNADLKAAGKSPHFIVDLCKPGHMTACLKDFQEIIGCSVDNWDATFSEQWTCSDLVDCIISYAVSKIVETICNDDGSAAARDESARMQKALAGNPRIAKRLLILSSLYARTDATSLMRMRSIVDKMAWASQISPLSAPTALVSTGGIVLLAAVTFALVEGASAGCKPSTPPPPSSSGSFQKGSGSMARSSLSTGDGILAKMTATVGDGVAALVERQGMIAGAGAVACGLSMAGALVSAKHKKNRKRASALQEPIRVVKRCSPEELACVLSLCASPNDTVETVRQVHVGVSAHQKLEKLLEVVKLLGYESLCVFGDCFDEIVLLDPQRFPSAIKKFAKEVCMNDLLNFGRMHFFLPDNRLQLDLTTDKTLKEARFDRHYVRDMTWSRHQLEELAEQRFQAAQEKYGNGNGNGDGKPSTSFSELFREVSGEDFAAFVGQLETPRQLMIMMTEMFSRMEQNPSGKLKAQDRKSVV